MRKPFIFLISLVVVMFTMTSCDWLNGGSDHSPEIYTSYFYVNPVFEGDSIIGAKDTLNIFSTDIEDSYRMDSLAFGDTVNFAAVFYSYEQDLVSVKIEWDSTRMDFSMNLFDDINKHITPQSNIKGGILYFNPGYNRVSFPCSFTAKESGVLPLKLTLASTSEFSPTSVLLPIPIKRP